MLDFSTHMDIHMDSTRTNPAHVYRKIDYNLSWYIIKVFCNFVQIDKVACVGMDLNRASRSCHPGPAEHNLSKPSIRIA